MFHTAKAFFGRDELAFSIVKIEPGMADVTRSYTRFTDVVKDTIDARVFDGVHFRTSDVQGAALGQQVAEWVAARYFLPAPPAPPATGTGGTLPGLPSTGAGGGAGQAPLGWLVLAAGGALLAGGTLVKRRARRA